MQVKNLKKIWPQITNKFDWWLSNVLGRGHDEVCVGGGAIAYAEFWKGGAEILRIIKTKKKNYPLRISSFSYPKLSEHQKKSLHSDLDI